MGDILLILVLGVLILGAAIAILYHLKLNFTKILFIIFVLFLVSAFAVILINHIDVGSKGWMTGFATAYYDWLSQIGNNVGDITGQIIKQDWTPK